ncbi:hypothetical protein M0R04_07875 [Candidatus Dojkabacteria bacterium]|jgi:hypothetical protein|nr:hypothetical protein [Candidatus Dojkabacteria bacterium]
MTIISKEYSYSNINTLLQNSILNKERNSINERMREYFVGRLPMAVKAASSTNIDLSTFETGFDCDGVTVNTDELVLLYSQTNPEENGVYRVPSTAPMTRTIECDNNELLIGSLVTVKE